MDEKFTIWTPRISNEKIEEVTKKLKLNDHYATIKIGGREAKILSKGGAEFIINELNLIIDDVTYEFEPNTKSYFVTVSYYQKLNLDGSINANTVGYGSSVVGGHLPPKSSKPPTAKDLDFAYNKAIKMAKKRAIVDAVLGLGFSGQYTQDIEEFKDKFDDIKITTEPIKKPPTAIKIENPNLKEDPKW